MQKKLNGAANRAATMELHNQGLSQRKIAMVLNISKTRVAQILKENNSQNGQSGQASQSKELTTILTGNPSVGQHLEEVVTQAAKQSVTQVIADEREVQREQVLDDLQYIRNWSIETAERVRSGCADLQNLQMELATMKVLSSILLENNRQRMDLFGLANKAKEVSDYSIDFIAAAREGGLKIKGPNSSDHPAEESDQT